MSKNAISNSIADKEENPQEKILLMLTSSQLPYAEDVLDLLSYPSNIQYRFRYATKYLHPELLVNDSFSKLPNQEALIIHVYTKKKTIGSNIIYQPQEFIPIRKAIILEAKLLGDFVLIDFTLGDWVVFENLADGKINPHHSTIKEILPPDYETDLKYVLFTKTPQLGYMADDISKINDKVLSNWVYIVSHVSRLGIHNKSVFTKLLELKDVDNNKKLSVGWINENLYGFELDSGRTYQIEILQRYYNKKLIGIPFNLELSTNDDQIMKIKGIQVVKGRYDILRFIFSCKSLSETHHSFIELKPNYDKKFRMMISSHLYNLKIKSKITKQVALVAGLGFGVAIVGLSQQIANFFGATSYSWIPAVFGATISATIIYFIPKR